MAADELSSLSTGAPTFLIVDRPIFPSCENFSSSALPTTNMEIQNWWILSRFCSPFPFGAFFRLLSRFVCFSVFFGKNRLNLGWIFFYPITTVDDLKKSISSNSKLGGRKSKFVHLVDSIVYNEFVWYFTWPNFTCAIATNNILKHQTGIIWIYPPPSNSGKWRFIGIPY